MNGNTAAIKLQPRFFYCGVCDVYADDAGGEVYKRYPLISTMKMHVRNEQICISVNGVQHIFIHPVSILQKMSPQLSKCCACGLLISPTVMGVFSVLGNILVFCKSKIIPIFVNYNDRHSRAQNKITFPSAFPFPNTNTNGYGNTVSGSV